MQEIMVLTEGYCGKATANGLCTKSLVDAMKNRGIDSYVVSCDNEENVTTPNDRVISIYRRPRKPQVRRRNKIVSAWRLLNSIIFHTWTPVYNKELVDDIVRIAEPILADSKVDTIISMYFPLETVVAGYRLKKMFPEKKLVVYELDSVSDGIAGSSKRNKHILFSHWRFMEKLYSKVDLVLVLKCHEKKWLQEHQRFAERMEITDLPLLCQREMRYKEKTDESITFLYAGALDPHYRNPSLMLNVFAKIDNELNWNVHMFSKGCEDILQEVIKNENRVVCHGYVEQLVLEHAIDKSDVLLSIGNRVSNSLPSKVITYLTYGKPIIHFSLQENDVCAEYLKRYPLSIVIEPGTDLRVAGQRIVKFVSEGQQAAVSFEQLCHIYPMNLPAYSIDVICNNSKGR